MSIFINDTPLFQYNPNNHYYEKGVETSREAIYRLESKICAVGAIFPALAICSRVVKEFNILSISTSHQNTVMQLGAAATAAVLFAGLFLTRLQLGRLNSGPPLDSSNSLTQSEIRAILPLAETVEKIKNLPAEIADSLPQLISHLQTDRKYARLYFSPAQRKACKRLADVDKHSRTKEEIVGLIVSAKRVLLDRKARWKEHERSQEERPLKSRAPRLKLSRFSIKEAEDEVSATIKRVKYPLELTRIEHLHCELERSIKGLQADPGATKIYIGEEASRLIEEERLQPTILREQVRVPPLLPLEKFGGLRRTTTMHNLAGLTEFEA